MHDYKHWREWAKLHPMDEVEYIRTERDMLKEDLEGLIKKKYIDKEGYLGTRPVIYCVICFLIGMFIGAMLGL